jgi:putative oxidoreductase
MKIVTLIARILLGAIFVFAGANHVVPFLPMGPVPPGVAGQFLTALLASHFLVVVGILEVVGGILLLINRFVPLALVLLGPIIVNIALIGILMTPTGLPPGVILTIFWVLVALPLRSVFLPFLEPRVAAK